MPSIIVPARNNGEFTATCLASILFAVSDLATFITGEVINVNGGSFPCG